MQTRNDALTEEQSILRSELGKLMRIARIGLPGAIYDASAAAQTFAGGEMADLQIEKEEFSKIEEKESSPIAIRNDFEHMPGFHDFLTKINLVCIT